MLDLRNQYPGSRLWYRFASDRAGWGNESLGPCLLRQV